MILVPMLHVLLCLMRAIYTIEQTKIVTFL